MSAAFKIAETPFSCKKNLSGKFLLKLTSSSLKVVVQTRSRHKTGQSAAQAVLQIQLFSAICPAVDFSLLQTQHISELTGGEIMFPVVYRPKLHFFTFHCLLSLVMAPIRFRGNTVSKAVFHTQYSLVYVLLL